MSKIPKVIHQTWKVSQLPYPFEEMASTWKDLHPGWEYKLWTDEMIREFIKTNFPDFLPMFDRYPRNIQRVDAFRYFLLLKEGGVYVDIDFKCLQNISVLLANKSCVIGKEPLLHCERLGMEMILCNAFMACEANNNFMRVVCDEIFKCPQKDNVTHDEVLNSTGPFMLTGCFVRYKNKQDVEILEAPTLYPLTMFETREAFKGNITADMKQRIDAAYAVHGFWGSWW